MSIGLAGPVGQPQAVRIPMSATRDSMGLCVGKVTMTRYASLTFIGMVTSKPTTASQPLISTSLITPTFSGSRTLIWQIYANQVLIATGSGFQTNIGPFIVYPSDVVSVVLNGSLTGDSWQGTLTGMAASDPSQLPLGSVSNGSQPYNAPNASGFGFSSVDNAVAPSGSIVAIADPGANHFITVYGYDYTVDPNANTVGFYYVYLTDGTSTFGGGQFKIMTAVGQAGINRSMWLPGGIQLQTHQALSFVAGVNAGAVDVVGTIYATIT